MRKYIMIGVVVLILVFGLASAAAASYGGIGSFNTGIAAGSGAPSARSSSLHGPAITGGGPGHGK